MIYVVKIKSEYDDLDKYKHIDGDIYYCKKNTDVWHNPYGPAYISDECIVYFIEDKYHRLDGPARIFKSGYEQYWINGRQLSKEDFEKHPERLNFIGKGYLLCIL